ncbi:MAG TPA: carboxypeptidase-like regulatory domain-containing protein [Terriglobales bacterium]|nr:carboxypeptidase-like regulatory domain-containing protein [Terriglobales bacterium]
MRTVKSLTLVMFFLMAALVWGQVATTSLRGTVFDEAGAVVNGATVTIEDPATGYTRTVKTTAQGDYQFPQIPPATYVLTATAHGFATIRQMGIKLLVDTPATMNVTLKVAAENVTVEVAGTAPMVNTQNATLGHAFETEQIASLPFEGRDPTGILSLQAGVVFTGNSSQIQSSEDSRSGSVSGARSDQTNVTLDGVDNNDQLLGTAFQGAVRVPLDSLEEFKVTTSNSDADTGRSSGGQVSLVTKSGTNHIHGGVYEYYRPTFTTANDWFNKQAELNAGELNVPPFLLRNTFGAFVGGPIKKDRLFYFLSYEGQRKRENLPVTREVPSADLRQGIMQYPCTGSTGCPASGVETLTRADLIGMDPNCTGLGTCPLGPGPNPAAMQIFQQYPLPNSNTIGDGFDFRGFTFSSPLPAKLDAYVGKVDYNITADGKHRLFVRGILNNDNQADRTSSSGYAITGNGGEQFPGQPQQTVLRDNNKGLSAGYTATLSNTLINNFHFGFVRQGLDEAGLQTQPYVNFRGMDNINAFTPTINTNVPVFNWVDDITKIRGSHTLQFGTNIRKVDNERVSNAQSFFFGQTNVYWLSTSCISCPGNTSLNPAAFGYPAVETSFGASYDFAMAALAGLVTMVNSNYELNKNLDVLPSGDLVPRHFRDHEYEWYAQDQWRIKPNLTFTYGARYSLLQPPYETTGTQVSPTISLDSWYKDRAAAMLQGSVYDPVIQFGLSGQANGKAPYWAWDYKDIAPRVALAYSPSGDSGLGRKLWGSAGQTSIRVGYGMYYDHFGEGITNTFDRNGSFGLTTSITNAAGIQTVDGSARFSGLYNIPTVSQTAVGSCTANCPIVEKPPSGPFPVTPPLGVAAGGFAIYWGLDDKLKTPYSHVVDFSIERQLPRGFVFEASYVGRFAHRLLQEEDLAEPTDLVDPATGLDYFHAAQAFAAQYYAGNSFSSATPQVVGTKAYQYWQDVFPGAAGQASSVLGEVPNANGTITPCNGSAPIAPTTQLSAPQAMFDLWCSFKGNETTALEIADVFCFPSCATIHGKVTPYAFYSPQFSSLFAWRSDGNSSYNGGQFSLRRHAGGLEFDLNYTYSKSIDLGSNAERINEFEGFGLGSQIINSWIPNQNRGVSDFDTTHAINANWIYELPVGNGKQVGNSMGRIANALFGGWSISGLGRWSTGYPFSTFSPEWATNFQLESQGVLIGNKPETGSFTVTEANGGPGPNVFKDPGITDPNNPNAAINVFRPAFPGERGDRNILRGPGTFDIDAGLSKAWHTTESQTLKFTWEVFNVTNTPRFDVGNMSLAGNTSLSSVTSFGNFTSTLSNARVMEFALRYSF